jgi:hypothetical protein
VFVEAPSDIWLDCWNACGSGNDHEGVRLVRLLFQHGEDEQVTYGINRFGALLQHQAASGNCVETLSLILNHPSARVNAKNRGGNQGSSTALHWAASRGRLEATRVLLKFGADTSIVDMDGFTPLKIALNRNFGDVADLIDPLGVSNEFEIGIPYLGNSSRKSKVNLPQRTQERSYERVVKADPTLGAPGEEEEDVKLSKKKNRSKKKKDKVLPHTQSQINFSSNNDNFQHVQNDDESSCESHHHLRKDRILKEEMMRDCCKLKLGNYKKVQITDDENIKDSHHQHTSSSASLSSQRVKKKKSLKTPAPSLRRLDSKKPINHHDQSNHNGIGRRNSSSSIKKYQEIGRNNLKPALPHTVSQIVLS